MVGPVTLGYCAHEAGKAAWMTGGYVLDGGKKLLTTWDGTYHLVKIFQAVLVVQEISTIPLVQTFRIISSYVQARHFVGKTTDLVTGDAWRNNPIQLSSTHEENGRQVQDTLPNFFHVAAFISWLVADFMTLGQWLKTQGMPTFYAMITENTAVIKVFGAVSEKTFEVFKLRFAIIAFMIDSIDVIRLMGENLYNNKGISLDHVLKLGANVAKIGAFFAFATMTGPFYWAVIANGTSSFLSAIRILKKEYTDNGDPVASMRSYLYGG